MSIKQTKIFTLILLILTTSLTLINITYALDINDTYTPVSNIDYTEDISNLRNPERGFYEPRGYNLKIENNQPLENVQIGLKDKSLIHLRVGLRAFSKNGSNKKDIELTKDALNALTKTLENIRKNNASVIIRFAYDNFEGVKDQEPSLDMILKHIEQLGPILLKNKDVVSAIEIGFLGHYGELHSSQIVTNQNIALLIDKLLDETDEKMKILVRTPRHYIAWRKIDKETIDTDITKKGTREYQIGIFNDGYLGSANDLGTFFNREKEIKWLKNQTTHTFYGGELVADYSNGHPINTIEYIEQEAFITHTTYLNLYWNNEVIESFKKTPYTGLNKLYKNTTAFDYLNNHLGYRYVLKNSSLTKNINQKTPLKIKLEIDNVGFANLINSKIVSIVLENKENNENIYEIKTLIDPTTWLSKNETAKSNITTIENSITLPDNIELGNFNVYLRISEYGNLLSDSNYHCIKFANKNIYNENIGANYIGEITIHPIQDVSDQENIDKTPKPDTPIESPPTGAFISLITLIISIILSIIIILISIQNKKFQKI